jgi:hypothetical protein
LRKKKKKKPSNIHPLSFSYGSSHYSLPIDPTSILFALIQLVSSSRDCARPELRAQCVIDEMDASYVVFLNSGPTVGPSKF